MNNHRKQSDWEQVKTMMGDRHVSLGQYLSYQFFNSPRRVLYALSYYKFAAKMIGSNKKVLDVGCGEGLGTWLLARECGQAKGVDIDQELIDAGKVNWKDGKIYFECVDFLISSRRRYDALVSFDVIEHILPKNIDVFWQKVFESLVYDGIAIIGTPNITADQYASTITKAGHVNVYSCDRLRAEIEQYFAHVFIFSANDEVVHTGFLPMAQYLIAIACHKRKL